MRTIGAEDAAYGRLRHELAQLRRTHPLPAIPVHVVTPLTGRVPQRWSPWARRQRRQAEALAAQEPAASVTRESVRPGRHLLMLQHPDRVAEAVLRTAAQAGPQD